MSPSLTRCRRSAVPRQIVALAVAALVVEWVHASDWNQFRGPEQTGISTETDWAVHGTRTWTSNVGLGYGCPSIAEGRLFVSGHFVEEELDTLFCLDASTGEELWSYSYPIEIYNMDHSGGALTTPTIDGDLVYLHDREGTLHCLESRTGKRRWSKPINEELGVQNKPYGFAASPVVMGDLIILCQSRVVALDKQDGSQRWASAEDRHAMYSTPTVFGSNRDLLAVFSQSGLSVRELANGTELAFHPWRKGRGAVNAATPLVTRGDHLFISSAYDHGCTLLQFTGNSLEPIWERRTMRTKMAGCVLHDGLLYGFDESMLKCVDLQGEERWRVRGLGNGALSIAGNRMLVLTSRGELIVAPATSERFDEQSRQQVLSGGTYWTAPVLADGRVYCRNSLGDLTCWDHRSRSSQTAGSSDPSHPNPKSFPPASTLLAAHRKQTGADDYAARKAVSFLGQFEMRSVGFTGERFRIDHLATGQWHEMIEAPGFREGEIHKYFDGEHGWEINPFRGNKLLEGNALREIQGRGSLGSVTDVARYESLNTQGVVDFADHRCWQVEGLTREGSERNLYFDVVTGLLRGHDAEHETLTILGDYRPFGDGRLPTRRYIFDPETGIESVYRTDEVVFDDVGPTLFTMPDEIRSLVQEAADSTSSSHEPR